MLLLLSCVREKERVVSSQSILMQQGFANTMERTNEIHEIKLAMLPSKVSANPRISLWRIGMDDTYSHLSSLSRTTHARQQQASPYPVLPKRLTLCLICPFSPFLLSLNIHVLGNISTEYVAEETPVPTYYNAHLALEQLRVSCRPPPSFLPSDDPIRSLHPSQQEDETLGPRVLVVGEAGSGKSTLCKSLINWAVRMGKARRDGDWTDYGEGRKVMFVNLDPADVRPDLFSVSLRRSKRLNRDSCRTGSLYGTWHFLRKPHLLPPPHDNASPSLRNDALHLTSSTISAKSLLFHMGAFPIFKLACSNVERNQLLLRTHGMGQK
jgi:hypothetical protein